MATLSRRTLAVVSKLLAYWSHTELRQLFYENEVPTQVDRGSNRLDRVLNVFQYYERERNTEMLMRLVESAVQQFGPDTRAEAENALLRDGFGLVDGRLLDAEPESQENRTVVDTLLDKYSADFNTTTLHHHLRESIDLFRQEKWDSSISHCRNFVEQLLRDIATVIAQSRSEQPNLSRPVLVRQYLENVGFLDKGEREKLVDGVYGYFSEEGSHPGLSTQSAARVSNSILSSFALYVLEKYDSWKSGRLVIR
jgi:hypothetical protein